MKIISLNTWGGKCFAPLMQFIADKAAQTDIFCFQEIYDSLELLDDPSGTRTDLLGKIKAVLPEFTTYYFSTQNGFVYDHLVNFPVSQGIALFVKKSIPVTSSGEFFINGEQNSLVGEDLLTLPRNIGYVTVLHENKSLTIANIHGIGLMAPKTDLPERILQSKKIATFITQQKNPLVLVGDFNLLPSTESLKMIENTGLRNLIKEYNIQTTRSSLYEWDDKFADYAFVSREIAEKYFAILPDVISDHLALDLEI